MYIKKRLTDVILDELLTVRCVYCHLAGDQRYICNSCKKYLRQYSPESFITRTINSDWSIGTPCPLSKVIYFYAYNTLIHTLIESLKYKGQSDLIREVTYLMLEARHFEDVLKIKPDYISYIPMYRWKKYKRGFNQSELIARELGYQLNIPVITLCEKKRNTTPQVELNRNQRLHNLKQSYIATSYCPYILSGKKVLLIDDICTTGATLLECSSSIKKKYPKVELYGVCLARG